jgi:hypothetical protein
MRMRPSRLLLLLVLLAQGQAAEVALHRWSGSLNVPDPVACAVDEAGRVYVTATTRRKVADLDIREHPLWIPDDVGLTSVEAKRAFLQRELATGASTGATSPCTASASTNCATPMATARPTK